MTDIPPHAFTPPGQVSPDRPAPDRCMYCGLPKIACERDPVAAFLARVRSHALHRHAAYMQADIFSLIAMAEDVLGLAGSD